MSNCFKNRKTGLCLLDLEQLTKTHTLLITKSFFYLFLHLVKSYHSLIALILPVVFIRFIFFTQLLLLNTFQALNGLLCADVPLRNYSLTHYRHGARSIALCDSSQDRRLESPSLTTVLSIHVSYVDQRVHVFLLNLCTISDVFTLLQ